MSVYVAWKMLWIFIFLFLVLWLETRKAHPMVPLSLTHVSLYGFSLSNTDPSAEDDTNNQILNVCYTKKTALKQLMRWVKVVWDSLILKLHNSSVEIHHTSVLTAFGGFTRTGLEWVGCGSFITAARNSISKLTTSKSWIKHATSILILCIYRYNHKPLDKENWKQRLKNRGVVHLVMVSRLVVISRV